MFCLFKEEFLAFSDMKRQQSRAEQQMIEVLDKENGHIKCLSIRAMSAESRHRSEGKDNASGCRNYFPVFLSCFIIVNGTTKVILHQRCVSRETRSCCLFSRPGPTELAVLPRENQSYFFESFPISASGGKSQKLSTSPDHRRGQKLFNKPC